MSSPSERPIHLYTIGFTEKSAEQFFGLLRERAITVVVDTRLKPDSQLSAFAKQRDLPFFLRTINNCDYLHHDLMPPTEDLLKAYRSDKDWSAYSSGYRRLLQERDLIHQLDRAWWADNHACLLCSEHKPDTCHRILVAEYLAQHWSNVEITHLM